MKTVIDEMLAAQGEQRPVERFAALRENPDRPAAFRDLIPLSKPGPGEQYAFEVDLDRCTGCKACVAACHSLNGLDEEETWREVGTLIGGTQNHARIQTVTSACHHCVEPQCLEGCPVFAYEKDPETGIVRHLDDQCIGCSYCILKCPYEVPKFSKQLGIVRKCDMCHGRLAAGEAPACVQACPTEAIRITVVDTNHAREAAANEIFLPDSPDPRITVPTTSYRSKKPLPERALAANHHRPRVQHTHWPLVLMLVLTQAGVGAATGSVGQGRLSYATEAAAGLFLAGMACSILHLGHPLKAWRAFLGWRTSWLSREIIVFGLVAPLLAFAAMLPLLNEVFPIPEWLRLITVGGGVLSGWIAVGCSAAVYHDTHRRVWRGMLSFGRFFSTTLLFAFVFAGQPVAAIYTLAIKLIGEFFLVGQGLMISQRLDDLDRSARLLRGPLRAWVSARFIAGLAAFPLLWNGWLAIAIFVLLLGELLERALFFKAGVSTRMPGV